MTYHIHADRNRQVWLIFDADDRFICGSITTQDIAQTVCDALNYWTPPRNWLRENNSEISQLPPLTAPKS